MNGDIEAWLRGFVLGAEFLRQYPYYAFVLAKLLPVVDPSVAVMGVSAHGPRFYLHVNPEFFTAHPDCVKGVLLHEVHHLVLGHLTDLKFQGLAHPDLLELAMEMAANEYITVPLPGEPVRWEAFARFGLAANQSTIVRYERLVQARRDGFEPLDVPRAWVDQHLPNGVAALFPDAPSPAPGAHDRVRRLIADAVEEAHRDPGVKGGRLAGKVPGNLLEELAGTEKEPDRYMDWRAAIQMFVGLVRTPVHTYARPSRRCPEKVGVIPGRIYYPGQADHPALLVAIDTSGSMSAAELAEVARHLMLLRDLVTMTVVECDVRIQRVYPFSGAITAMLGRGGTDLRPVFTPEFLSQHRADGVIYFTDGWGPYPEQDPGIPTLWVLTKPVGFGCGWGEKAYFPSEGGVQP
ncbi:MAG: hypothetical protein JXR37_27090 [Kiritimatiellae bacterium]|nr:hypothetical protein [Kiritimatiellia bacterium]